MRVIHKDLQMTRFEALCKPCTLQKSIKDKIKPLSWTFFILFRKVITPCKYVMIVEFTFSMLSSVSSTIYQEIREIHASSFFVRYSSHILATKN